MSKSAAIDSNHDARIRQNLPSHELNHHKTIRVHTADEISVKQNDVFLDPHKINDKYYAKKSILNKRRYLKKIIEDKKQPEVESENVFEARKTKLTEQDGDIVLRLQARDNGWSHDPVAQALLRERKVVHSESNKIPKCLDPFHEPERVLKSVLTSDSLIEEIESYVKYAGASYCTIHSYKNSQCNYCKEFGNGVVTFPLIDTLKFNGKIIEVQAIIVIDSMKEEIILAYRGSDNISKLLGSISDDTLEYLDVPEAKVHAFFYEAVRYIHEKVANKLDEVMKACPDFKLVITGHSLGGALATLAAPLIEQDLGIEYSKMRIITYGQLRVGNLAFAVWYNSLKINFTRVVNEDDGATNMHKMSKDWVHVQNEVHIYKGIYYDCKTSKIEHPHCSLLKTSLYGLLSSHSKVDQFILSPDYYIDWNILFTRSF